MTASSLSLLAGPDALRIVRERGLRPGDVDVLPAASGGPKWLVLAGLADLPTAHLPLTRESLKPALLASASIPLVLSGVRVPGTPGGIHRDGGIIDYHPDLDFGAGEGIVLYPHFYPHVVPGWFDRPLRWRWAGPSNFGRALRVAPSAEFVARLPGGKIPDRNDFYRMGDSERIRAWRATMDASRRLADELRELLETGRLAEGLRPL